MEVALKRHAPPKPTGDEHHLRGTRAEERQVPQERVAGAGIRPGRHRKAEETRRQEGEQVEESVKAAAPHQAQEDEDIGEVEDGALRGCLPLFTHWLRRLGSSAEREVHRFEIWRLHDSRLKLRKQTKQKNTASLGHACLLKQRPKLFFFL